MIRDMQRRKVLKIEMLKQVQHDALSTSRDFKLPPRILVRLIETMILSIGSMSHLS